jgi:hypothetical protein
MVSSKRVHGVDTTPGSGKSDVQTVRASQIVLIFVFQLLPLSLAAMV